MPKANDRQVGGDHYKAEIQHWDWVVSAKIPYLEGVATKYIARHAKKNGFQDLLKAEHYLHKMMEVYYPQQLEAHLKAEAERMEQAALGAVGVVNYLIQGSASDMGREQATNPVCFFDGSAHTLDGRPVCLYCKQPLDPKGAGKPCPKR